jgi:hypothetical protein
MKRWERTLPWLAAFLGPVLLFGPMLLRGEAPVWGTSLLQFVPWRALALRILSAGHWPLWNPWLGGGAPLLANYQSALLYPPNWLMALTGPAWGGGLLTMLHLAWAGVGMVVLTRRLGLGAIPQTIAAVSFGLSNALVARGSFQTILAAAAWIPWLVAAADGIGVATRSRTPTRSRGRAVILCGAVFGLQWLAGHAQFSWYSLLLAVVWAGARGFSREGWRGAGRSLAMISLAALLGFGLAAAQLLPTAEYLLQSSRGSGLDPDYALTYSLWPWRILGWLLPGLFGSPAAGDYWGYGTYWEDALYIGVLPFLLAVVGLIRAALRRGPEPTLARTLGVVFVVAHLFALGKNTPLYPFLFRAVPTFDLFQAPARWGLLAVFAASVLAALAAEGWHPLRGAGLSWTRLGTAGAAALAISAWLAGPRLVGVEPTFIRAFALAGSLAAVAGALILLRGAAPGWRWSFVVAGFLVVDLTIAGYGLNPSAPRSLFEGETALAGEIGAAHRTLMPSNVEYDLKFWRFFRFDSYDSGADWRLVREAGLPNTLLLDGISSADNFDPLQPARYVEFREALESLAPSRQEPLLALMDVGWRAAEDPSRLEGVRYEPVTGPARVRMVPTARWAESSAQALQIVMSADFRPDLEVVLEGAPPEGVLAAGTSGRASLAADEDPNRLRVSTESTGGSWLVVSDVVYPGWEATVDGAPSAIYPADSLFRAVWVPAGSHEVVFEYRPVSVLLGALLSLASLGFVVVIGFRWRAA